MSASNGVIRIGRKGIKKFAFGEDGVAFDVDVVVTFQEWVNIDEQFRDRSEDRTILTTDMPKYHEEAVRFAVEIRSRGTLASQVDTSSITTAEALDFIARLRECYDEVSVFFRPKLRKERDLPDSSEAELRFSTEES